MGEGVSRGGIESGESQGQEDGRGVNGRGVNGQLGEHHPQPQLLPQTTFL